MAELLSHEAMSFMARELGVDGIVAREGWAGVPSRECGRVVQLAIRLAEESLARGVRPPAGGGAPRRRGGF